MPKKEALFQTIFNNWCRQAKMPTACYELKQTKTALPFSAVKDHQINALLAAKKNIICYKIPDDTRSYRPFDSFCLRESGAFVVIKYPRAFYGIDIDAFLEERTNSKRRSLSEERAKELSLFRG